MREDQLLQRFAAKRSEAAFAELVRRNLDFVYSVCRRKVGDRELAQDITQTVFLILAAKAGTFKQGTVLSGWLFQTAHRACQNALRTEARRQHYERQATLERGREMEQAVRSTSHAPLDGGILSALGLSEQWGQLEPVLDDALAALSTADRDAVFLRYVEEMSPEEIGVALGISAAASQKRVSRAVERLRRSLQVAGSTLSVGVIGVLLTQKMVQAAPPSVVSSILAAVGQGGQAGLVAVVSQTGHGHLLRFGRPAALSKAQAAVALGLLGATGSCVLLFIFSAQTHRPAIAAGVQAVVSGIGPVANAITLRGSVLSSSRMPSPDADVSILRYDAVSGALSRFAEVRTDRSGRYIATGVSSAQGQGASAQDRWAVVVDSGSRLGFGVPGAPCVLLPPTQIHLRFVGSDGRPLAGLVVQPLLLTGPDAAGRQETVNLMLCCPQRLAEHTDAAGNVLFQGLPQGVLATFAVMDQKYQRRPPSADGLLLARGPESGGYTVPVELGASVSGRLLYGTTHLPAGDVRIGAQETSTSAWGEAQTDAQGRYQVRQLPPGRYTVAVDEQSSVLSGRWTAAAVSNVALEPGRPAAIPEMYLVPGVLITGTVIRRGSRRPVEGTEIGAYGPAHPATGAWVSGGWTGADGTYEIRVPPGQQHVYPMAVPGSRGTDITVQDGQKAVVDLSLP